MRLDVVRYSGGSEATLGLLFEENDSGRTFLCYTLEDEYRKVKVKGETCIPEGEYALKLRTVGGFHEKYAARYGAWHRGMLWLQDVPGFEYILIHCGNTDDDTAGCLLVGDSAIQNVTKEGSLGASRSAYKRIYPPIADALESGKSVTIRYTYLEGVDPA